MPHKGEGGCLANCAKPPTLQGKIPFSTLFLTTLSLFYAVNVVSANGSKHIKAEVRESFSNYIGIKSRRGG